MYFERIYDEDLAQAAYVIGCAATGEALVVDPLRDIDQYFDRIDELGFELTGVIETHIHADFLSGGRDLARSADTTLYISGETVEGWEYGSLEGLAVERLSDGDAFEVGNIRLEALHTPGHTPEH
ncbi:MAG: MBL fold metallo-hydrolase, partial [Bradymonadaceae bacterium]